MKVRFYRGPWDGKVKHMADHMIDVRVAVPINNYVASSVTSPTAPITINQTRYVRTKHTHPDGSVYFEWDQPRGTPTGVPRKRKYKQPTFKSTFNTTFNGTIAATGVTMATLRAMNIGPTANGGTFRYSGGKITLSST
jgi:hypothetical protein